MITKLALENFKSHEHSEFAFSKGTNILVGRMGAGKSSVLDAICFALYGTFPRLARRDITTEDLVRIGSMAPYAKVELEFEKEGKKYQVVRKIGKNLSDAELRCDGKLLQKGTRQTTALIEEILGTDYELFSRAIYSEQNRMDFLLSLNPKQRKTEIDWLLGLGQFDDAAKEAQTTATRLQQQAEALSLPQDQERLSAIEKQIGEYEKELQSLGQELESLRRAIEGALKAKQEIEAEVKLLEDAKTRWAAQTAECKKLEGLLERLKKEAEGKAKPEKQALYAAEKKAEAFKKEMVQKRQELEMKQKAISLLSSRIAVAQSAEKLRKERKEKAAMLKAKAASILQNRSLQEAEELLSRKKEEAEALGSQCAAMRAKIEQLGIAIKALEKADAKCPVCDSFLNTQRAVQLRKEKEAEKKRQEEDAEKICLQAKEAQKEAAKAENAIAEAMRLLSEAEAAEKEQELPQEDIERLKQEAEKEQLGYNLLQERLFELQQQLLLAQKEAEEIQRLDKLFGDLEDAKTMLAKSQAELESIKFDQEEYELKKRRLSEASLELARKQQEEKGKSEKKQVLEKMIESLRNEWAQIRQRQSKAKRYAEAAESMRIYKNCLVAAQTELRSDLIEEINAALAEIWPAIYPYSDYKEVKIEADEKDYRFLMFKDEWREVDNIASGGERACLCLALRIAFASVLTPNLSWLVLDEPTHNLDSDAIALLSEAIQTKIPQIVQQTFIITHESALGQAAQGTVWNLERDKSADSPTRASQIS
ncbi:MAG: AAA family ATPase [Candidatus Micrarchaeota archaeon]|nr:AAA family ATPase [Candidatus Micrarchaeota archaeon]